jgi:hypothetical protein
MPIRHLFQTKVKSSMLRAVMKLGEGSARIGEDVSACPFTRQPKKGWWEKGWHRYTEKRLAPRFEVHTGLPFPRPQAPLISNERTR